MCISLARSLGSALLVSLLLVVATMPAGADGPSPIAIDTDRVAIKGYDTVAYFTDGKAVKGTSLFEYEWDYAKWRFATSAHRDMFATDPDRYMPQFGGFCSSAIANEALVPANPESWTIVDGKLYMFAGDPDPNEISLWIGDAASNIQKANQSWPVVQSRWAAQNQ